MKKYKLLKDLPLAKAGTVVTLRKSTDASNIFNENNDRMYAIIDNTDINEWLEEIPEKPKSVWELQKYNHEPFYRINEEGIIKTGYLCKEYMENALNLGILFLTREEAEKELEKRKAIQKIKKYCWENGIDMNFINQTELYTFCSSLGQIKIYSVEDVKIGTPIGYFSNENAQIILDNFYEELKIILN